MALYDETVTKKPFANVLSYVSPKLKSSLQHKEKPKEWDMAWINDPLYEGN
jgi:hypothetical protein